MSSWTLHKTFGNKKNLDILIVNPHGASADYFFSQYPDFLKHPEIADRQSLVATFLKLECDRGATSLSLKIAEILHAQDESLSIEVISMNYPRAILDGGRLPSHLIREWIPLELKERHQEDWLAIHEQTLAELHKRYDQINHSGGLFIDVHTMASLDPVDQAGEKKAVHATLEDLNGYIADFRDAPQNEHNRRLFDVITADDHNEKIADPKLRSELINGLNQANILWAENEPYRASSHFMMHYHLTRAMGIACDVPKDYLAKEALDSNFDVVDFEEDPSKIEMIAQVISQAMICCLRKKRS